MVTSLFAASSVFAFGGGGGDSSSSPQRYQTGVDSFGTHFGGEGQVQIQFSCVDNEQATSDYGLCTCLTENAEFDYTSGKCTCKTGWTQKGASCELVCPEIENCAEYDENCGCQSCKTRYDLQDNVCIFDGKCSDASFTKNECGSGQYCQFEQTACFSDLPKTGVCVSLPEECLNQGDNSLWSCDTSVNWWTAQSVCLSQGKTMVSLNDIGCSTSQSSCASETLSNISHPFWTRDTDGCNVYALITWAGNFILSTDAASGSGLSISVLCQ